MCVGRVDKKMRDGGVDPCLPPSTNSAAAVPMRMPWADCARPAAGLSCSELAESFVDGCTGELVRTIELQRDLLLANAGAAAAVGRAAPPWQLAIGTLIAAFLIYHHGRGMAWMALSLSLVLFQFTYAVWQMCMIGELCWVPGCCAGCRVTAGLVAG